MSQWTIHTWFDKARVDSGIDFQLRDLRPKNASDSGVLSWQKNVLDTRQRT